VAIELLPPSGVTPGLFASRKDISLRPVRRRTFAPRAEIEPSLRDGNAVDKPVPKWHHATMEQAIEEHRKRITARVSDTVRDTLEQAAELLGATVNQFVVQTAYMEAQRVIERESVIRLSQRDAHKVLALLDNPPKASKRLKAAVKAFKSTVRE
jgi:uncharacterized protein (DUF1778 family)